MEQHAGRLPGALALGYARVSTYGKTLDVQVDLFAIVEQIVDAKAQFQNLNYAPLSPVKSSHQSGEPPYRHQRKQ